MWIARDKNGKLYLHIQKPELMQVYLTLPNSLVYASDCEYGDENYTETKNRAIGFINEDYDEGTCMVRISSNLFPEVTFENSPIELKLNLKQKPQYGADPRDYYNLE